MWIGRVGLVFLKGQLQRQDYLKLSVSLSRYTPGGHDDSIDDSDHHALDHNDDDDDDDNNDLVESKFGKNWCEFDWPETKASLMKLTPQRGVDTTG